jgi:DNA/RNA endonuclease YhcR with UshA esterase domain
VGRGADLVLLEENLAIASPCQLARLAAQDAGQMVLVEGTIVQVDPFSAGTRCLLDDGSGTVTVLLWQDLYGSLADREMLAAGTKVRVQGEVAEYRGSLEVIPQIPSDVQVLATGEPPATEVQLGELDPGYVGRVVSVQGVLRSLQAFSSGVRGTLDDGTGTLTLLIWQDLYEKLPGAGLLATGAQVAVRGKVAEYQGDLEVVPRLPVDVRLVASAPAATPPSPAPAEAASVPSPTSTPEPTPGPTATSTVELPAVSTVEPTVPEATVSPLPTPTPPSTPTPASETRAIGAISREDVGRVFTIVPAGVTAVDHFSAGVKYTLVDGTGSIVLLLWQNILEVFPGRYDLVPGSHVQVTGFVDEFAGDLEIIPRGGAGVQVLSRGERLPIEERSAANVTASDEGRIFTIQGSVTRIEGSGWVKVWLGDGTGEILVFVPERTVDYLPSGIGPGIRLRVTGEVDIYQNTLEIIPLAGADVEVLGP